MHVTDLLPNPVGTCSTEKAVKVVADGGETGVLLAAPKSLPW